MPVIALAQLNREVENRTSNRPQLSDLRSSGEIEQDADVIILMHRVKEGGDYTDLIVGKHRNGQIGEVRTKFDSARMTFTDILDIPHFPDHHAMKD